MKIKRGHLLILLYGASTLMFLQFFQTYLLKTDFPQENIGLLVSAGFLIDILISIPTGAYADLIGVRKISIFGILLLAVGSLLSIFSSSWAFLVSAFILYKIADTTVSGVLNVWARNLPESVNSGSSGFIFTRLDQMQRIGMILMAIFAGIVIQNYGYSSAIPWVTTSLLSLALIYLALNTECTTKYTAKKITTIIGDLTNSIRENVTLRWAFLGVLILGVSEGLMLSKFWVWINKDLGLGTPIAIALIVAMTSISRVAGQEFFTRKIINERKRFLTALFGISILTWTCTLSAPAFVLVLLWMVRIFFYAPYFPLLNKELESLATKSTVSTVLSAPPMLNALGGIIGGMVCAKLSLTSDQTYVGMSFLSLGSGLLWVKAFAK